MLVYGTRLWFDPTVPLQEPVGVVARWLSRKVGKSVPPGPFLESFERTFDGTHRVRSIATIAEAPRILAISYSHPDSEVNGRLWVTEIGLRQESATSDTECT